MKRVLKRLILSNEKSTRLALYFLNNKWLFDMMNVFNTPFAVRLINEEKIKLYPKGQIAEVIFQNKFENNELLIFQKLLRSGMTVVDAGANIGLYSLIASKIIGNNGRVFSFEPSKETFQRLKKNIELNRTKNVKIVNCGLGDSIDQELMLRQDLGYDDAERYIVPFEHNINPELSNVKDLSISEKVKIDTLDNFCVKNNIEQINLLKIDTEGFEFYILNGAKCILEKSENLVILMECTELGTRRANTSQESVFKILTNLGFKIFYWNKDIQNWSDDIKGCLNAGDLWVTKTIENIKI